MSKPEIYVSIDIESDGPAPGLYSMLALGAAAFDGQTDQVVSTWYATLFPLPGAARHPDTMAWWDTQPAAWAEVNRGQRQPNLAIPDFARWCTELPGRPVAVGWPIGFDFAFVNWYCWAFAGANPLGIGGADIRSYLNGLAAYPGYHGMPREKSRAMHGEVSTDGLRDHVAVDDATGQGLLFMALRRKALARAADIG